MRNQGTFDKLLFFMFISCARVCKCYPLCKSMHIAQCTYSSLVQRYANNHLLGKGMQMFISFTKGMQTLEGMANLWLKNQYCICLPASRSTGECDSFDKAIVTCSIDQNLSRQVSPRQTSVLDTDMPIPPYMPMQSSTSKKSASLERKIKKKKEKEGCKQQ